MEITKSQFDSFEKVRLSGKYNMIMEARLAIQASGLTDEQYWHIIANYGDLRDEYQDKHPSTTSGEKEEDESQA